MAWSSVGNIRGPQGPQGVQGVQGNTGATGVSGVTARGAWVSTNSYAVNDLVTWGGSSYICTTTRPTNSNPPTGTSGDPGTDDSAVNTGWSTFAIQGAQGIQGPQGTAGTAGATGATGAQGATGATGATGARGSQWYTGTGAPGTIGGSLPGDQYLDTSTGNVYTLS